MKSVLAAAFVVGLSGAQVVHAQAVSPEGARGIETGIVRFLGDKVGQAITVRPDGDRYRMDIDSSAVATWFSKFGATLSLSPNYTQFLTPLARGLWKLEMDQGLSYDLTQRIQVPSSTTATETREVRSHMRIDNMKGSGTYDEALQYFRDYSGTMSGVSWRSDDGKQQSNGKIDAMDVSLTGTPGTSGGVDIAEKVNGNRMELAFKLGGPLARNVLVDSFTINVSGEGVRLRPLVDIVRFVAGLDGDGPLSQAQKATLLQLAKASLPIVGKVEEHLEGRGISFGTDKGDVSIRSALYGVRFAGVNKNSEGFIDLSVAGLKLPDTMVPVPGAAALVPDEVSASIGMTGLNIADAADYLLSHLERAPDAKMPPDELKALQQIALQGDKLNFAFHNVKAKSAIYDLDADGTVQADVNNTKDVTAHFVIHARNLDTTVKYLQDHMKEVPQFGQASFVLLMMKGFAKPDANGALQWDIEVDQDKKIKVNGNLLPFQQ